MLTHVLLAFSLTFKKFCDFDRWICSFKRHLVNKNLKWKTTFLCGNIGSGFESSQSHSNAMRTYLFITVIFSAGEKKFFFILSLTHTLSLAHTHTHTHTLRGKGGCVRPHHDFQNWVIACKLNLSRQLFLYRVYHGFRYNLCISIAMIIFVSLLTHATIFRGRLVITWNWLQPKTKPP